MVVVWFECDVYVIYIIRIHGITLWSRVGGVVVVMFVGQKQCVGFVHS